MTRKCTGKVYGDYRDVSGRVHPCNRSATIERAGKWYCWQHDPKRVKAEKERRLAKWKTKDDKRQTIRARRAAEYRTCQGVSTETLEKLGPGGLKRLLDAMDERE